MSGSKFHRCGYMASSNLHTTVRTLQRQNCRHERWVTTGGAHFVVLEFVDIALTDLQPSISKPIPQVLPQSLLETDGLALLLLFRSTQDAARHVTRRAMCRREVPVRDLVPGWKVVQLVNIREAGEFTQNSVERFVWSAQQSGLPDDVDTFPFVFISRPREDVAPFGLCRILLTVRPTANMYEWKIDLMTNQRSMGVPSDVLAHLGFITVLNSVAPPIDIYITEVLQECSTVDITVTGENNLMRSNAIWFLYEALEPLLQVIL